ncbi:MAG: ABC transporter substrate-binding protein [Prosthecochloris sp.]|uniref:ABC transporter substrate-binding protein n=1 Tax=Prosthecochloris sp. TaxID=290513 RepID=UPI0013C9B9C6|nr:ABC transporter substrate-binding protein [Prosthecochloris sp.]NEX12663.1 ABC transporter substrate-binding protein [Prosthecochloris sp.]
MRKILLSLTILFLFTALLSCRPGEKARPTDHISIGIAADFDYLNPLLMQLSLSREVCTLIYPSLVKPSYNEAKGEIEFLPAAADSWEFDKKGRKATFHLNRQNVWQDGTPLTAHDFAYSYRLYANPEIASTRQHYLNDFIMTQDATIDFDRSVETPDDYTLILHFSHAMAPEIILDHFNDLMPVAKHVYEAIPAAEIRMRATEIPVIGAGPFKVKKWARQEKLVLESNPLSRLPHPAVTTYMSYIVVPEYTTRLTMLKSGQLDALISAGGLNPKDIGELERTNPEIVVRPVKDRYFDSIVWLNIDGERYRTTGEVVPNTFFGDKTVRQAMTYAIDRQSIIDGFMGPLHAEIVNTSLSPAYEAIAFKSTENYDYNPDKALKLLQSAGWTPGPDGILQKNATRFSFSLAAPVGNPRRNYAATIIQQNLREIGIDCKMSIDENLIFLKNQNDFRYDAALSGLAAETLPFQLIIWGSDFKKRPFNSSAFQHEELDHVIDNLSQPLTKEQKSANWLRYQEILHEEQPRTFLYYYDELEGFNKRVQNVEVNLLSTLYNAYDWRLE